MSIKVTSLDELKVIVRTSGYNGYYDTKETRHLTKERLISMDKYGISRSISLCNTKRAEILEDSFALDVGWREVKDAWKLCKRCQKALDKLKETL